MASAILTVLYPETFTIYDIRVCNILNNYHRIQNRTNFDTLWLEYETYIAAVRASVQEDYTLVTRTDGCGQVLLSAASKGYRIELQHNPRNNSKQCPRERGIEPPI